MRNCGSGGGGRNVKWSVCSGGMGMRMRDSAGQGRGRGAGVGIATAAAVCRVMVFGEAGGGGGEAWRVDWRSGSAGADGACLSRRDLCGGEGQEESG